MNSTSVFIDIGPLIQENLQLKKQIAEKDIEISELIFNRKCLEELKSELVSIKNKLH